MQTFEHGDIYCTVIRPGCTDSFKSNNIINAFTREKKIKREINVKPINQNKPLPHYTVYFQTCIEWNS